MDYLKIQNELLLKYQVTLIENSTCWRRTHAHCDGSRRICKLQIKNSYASLFTLLHEIGHLETTKTSMKRCESESEATRWAITELRKMKIPVKRKFVQKYKAYITMTYERGVRRGLKKKVTLIV